MEYRKMAAIFGAAIFSALFIFFVTVIWLAESRIFFTRDYIVYVEFKDVSGLKRMSPVYMRGYRIGWVKGVKFEKDHVLVRTDINKHYPIPKGSRAEIFALNILGEKAIRIIPPSPPYSGYLSNRDRMKGVNKDIMFEAQSFLGKLKKPLEEKFPSAVDRVYSILGNIDSILKELKSQVANSRAKENIEALGKAAEAFRKAVEENQSKFSSNLDELSRTLKALREASRQMQQTAKSLNETLETLNKGKGTAGALLHERKLLERTEKLLQELQALLEDMRKNPKKYFKFSIF